jgi:uncharacterized protein YegL
MSEEILNQGAQGVTANCTNIIFLLDTSGSMYGERINQLNYGMSETLNVLVEESFKQETDVYIRVIEFNTNVKWVVGSESQGVAVEDVARSWQNLTANGGTDTASAIEESLKALRTQYTGLRNKKPIVILITDGDSNDRREMERATDKLKVAMSGGSGKEKIVRIAIGVKDYNEGELNYFASKGTVKDDTGEHENVPFVFGVDDAEKIAEVIKNVTVSSLKSVGQAGPVQMADSGSTTTNTSTDIAMDDEPIVIDTTKNTSDFWGAN